MLSPIMNIEQALTQFAAGQIDHQQVTDIIQRESGSGLDYAQIDFDRLRRRGLPETVFCPGKTADQVIGIMRAMRENGQNVMATRATTELAATVCAALPDAAYHAQARILTLDSAPLPEPQGLICVVSAGTADIPVAEEARITAWRMGANVETVYDVGVAGLHRLLARLDIIRRANVVIVAAGMEGALPSVVAGLIDKPLIAVPTSIGYGMNLEGVTALLAMLNSCAAGITVVNIDNGFGAGIAAAMINRQTTEKNAQPRV